MESRGQIRDNWSAFTGAELPTAWCLRDLGIQIVSIDTMGGRNGSAPDGAIPRLRLTFDIKRSLTGSHGGVQAAFDRAAKQSRRVVIDTRGSAMSEPDAITAVDAALRRTGGDFDELLMLGDGWGILWP